MDFRSRFKFAAIAAGTAIVAGAAAIPFTDLPVLAAATTKDAGVLSVMHSRSPAERQAGALAKKAPAMSMKLPASVPARVAAPVATAAAPVSKVLPVAAVAPAAVPMAAVPAAAVIPAAVVPAAAAAPAASSLFVPPLIIPGGGGGGGGITVTAPPGGGGGNPPPPPVPGVPEPGTWAMMIVGFGLLGAFLRRRRRTAGEFDLGRDAIGALEPAAR